MNKTGRKDRIVLSTEEYLKWIRIKKQRYMVTQEQNLHDKKNPAEVPGNV